MDTPITVVLEYMSKYSKFLQNTATVLRFNNVSGIYQQKINENPLGMILWQPWHLIDIND